MVGIIRSFDNLGLFFILICGQLVIGPCVLCWKKVLDLNAMIELPFGGVSRRGPNMISVPEHNTGSESPSENIQ